LGEEVVSSTYHETGDINVRNITTPGVADVEVPIVE